MPLPFTRLRSLAFARFARNSAGHLAVKSELTGFFGDAPGFDDAPLNIVFDP
jgi:hypothetical protein